MTDVAIILNGDGLVTLPRSVLRNLVERAERAEAERDALRAAADGLSALSPPDEVFDDTFDAGWYWLQGLLASALAADGGK